MAVEELQPAELAEWRRKVSAAQQNRWHGFKRPVWIQFDGGPLDGIRCAIDSSNARDQFLAWCLVRSNGPVQAIYCRSDQPGVWRFAQLELGVR